jgi:nitrilase
MLVAAIQMTSAPEVAANLAAATALLAEAAAAGARVAVLPENFAIMGRREADKLAVAEAPGDGPIQTMLAQTAARLGIWIVAGTVPVRVADEARVAPASLVYDDQGRQVARYDKIHLFDVDIPGRDESYRESASNRPGQDVVVVDTPAGRLGLSVCYDVRFPELFRQMSVAGATWFTVPAAFTVPTGAAHWETLLRARAIENLCAVVAAAQVGQHASGRLTYGYSMIIDHWGRVLAVRPEQPGVVLADLDAVAQAETRQRFPALAHRRLGL